MDSFPAVVLSRGQPLRELGLGGKRGGRLVEEKTQAGSAPGRRLLPADAAQIRQNTASSACAARSRGSDLDTSVRAAGNVRPPLKPGQLLHSAGSTRTHTLRTVEPRIALQLSMQRARARCHQQRAQIRAADATLASASPHGLHWLAARALCGERERDRDKTGKGGKV